MACMARRCETKRGSGLSFDEGGCSAKMPRSFSSLHPNMPHFCHTSHTIRVYRCAKPANLDRAYTGFSTESRASYVPLHQFAGLWNDCRAMITNTRVDRFEVNAIATSYVVSSVLLLCPSDNESTVKSQSTANSQEATDQRRIDDTRRSVRVRIVQCGRRFDGALSTACDLDSGLPCS